jgi:hypothetical protein
MARYTGGCHCGRVRFAVDADLADATECNCSVCTKKGFVHVIVPRAQFVLEAGEGEISTYRFGTGVAQHHFCRTCGIASYYVPRSHPDAIDVNARCLDGVDVSQLRPRLFDGRNWEHAIETLRPRGGLPS